MDHPGTPSPEDTVDRPLRAQFETFLDQHRLLLTACLDGLVHGLRRGDGVPPSPPGTVGG